jgi:hypothetical protein
MTIALEAEQRPSVDDPEIQALIALDQAPKGQRTDTILKIMNAAGKSGWTNHQILALASGLVQRWGVHPPEKNLFEHWSHLLKMLGNVRSHYPAPAHDHTGQAVRKA